MARILAALALSALLATLLLGSARADAQGAVQAGTTFTVNTTDTVNDHVCDATHCSLIDARDEADATSGKDTILFNISGSAPFTIAPSTQLVFEEPVDLLGDTQPGWSVGHPVVILDGSNLPGGMLQLNGGDSTVRGFVIHRVRSWAITLEPNLGHPFVGGNVVEGNFIGTDVTGTKQVTTCCGVLVPQAANTTHPTSDGAPNNRIGGTTPEQRNVIAAAGGVDVELHSSGNVVQGNFIGTDAGGTATLPSTAGGVDIRGDDNVVGGTVGVTPGGPCTGACNVIAGTRGLLLGGSHNKIQGNLIGTDATGTRSLGIGGPAHSDGVLILPDEHRDLAPCNRAIGNKIGGTESEAGNVIAGSDSYGVTIESLQVVTGTPTTCGPTDNRVEGNLIGTDATGTRTTDASGKSFGNLAGIRDVVGTDDIIGGPTAAARNVISNNANEGVNVTSNSFACGCTGKVVQNNLIGTDVTGTKDLGNGSNGIIAGGDASSTLIADNVVAGNGGDGVHLSGRGSSERILGNRIGANAAGDAAIPNDRDGVNWSLAAGTIGGSAAAERNVISGNRGDGINASSPGLLRILNNFIGTDASGTAKLPNAGDGAELGQGVQLGEPEAGNVISGNGLNGVFVTVVTQRSPTIQANMIGTSASGAATLGNTQNGISLRSVTDVHIGGTSPGEANVIAGNGGDGVSIFGIGAVRNPILGNSIFANGDLGIDLGADGVTPNDLGDGDSGPNASQNFPVLTSASGGLVEGTLNSQPSNSQLIRTFRIELFSTSGVAACDSSGNAEGETFLGSTEVKTDTTGNASFAVTLPSPISPGSAVTATATDSQGNTSEFSQCRATPPAGTIVVRKQTLPSGNSQSFAFTTSYGSGFSLKDGGSNTSGPLGPGSYSVGESVPTGWDQTSATCDDGSPVADIGVGPGETVTCTFVNTQRGHIVVKKQTLPAGSSERFAFTSSYGLGFSLGDGESNTSDPVAPRSYSVSETVPAGWEQASASCDDGSEVTGIAVGAGETVTCTFVNRQFSINQPPVASDGSAVTDQKTPVDVTLVASDADGDALTYSIVSGPTHGALSLLVGNRVTYTPSGTYSGQDSFTFKANDGKVDSNTATISITVKAVNLPPDAVNDSLRTFAGISKSVAVLANDLDQDGDPLTVSASTNGAHGAVSCTETGQCTYAPASGFKGSDVFTYTISDGRGGSDTASVAVTVVAADTAPPSCTIDKQGSKNGRPFTRFRIRDAGSGLARYEVVTLRNATVAVDPFTAGTTTAVFMTATAITNDSLGVSVDFYDVAGNRTTCDPIMVLVSREEDQPEDQTFTDVPQAEHYVTIQNGNPGMRKVKLVVNRTKFKEVDLRPDEVRSFDIAAAMKPGNANTITVSARGKKGGSAVIVIADIPPASSS